MGWLGHGEWTRQLDFDIEGSLANSYSAVVWGLVAVLGLAQLIRGGRSGSRSWLWVVGWLSVAFLAALIAVEEWFSLKHWVGTRAASVELSMLELKLVPPGARWLLAAVPILALPLAAAGWVLYKSQQRRPASGLLTVLAALLAIEAVVQDAFNVLGISFLAYAQFLEEGSEVVAAATLVVVLAEMLAESQGAVPVATGIRQRRSGWLWALYALVAMLLAASALALLSPRSLEGQGWRQGLPRYYTGPVTLVEQRFRASHNNLRRIDVWSYVDGGEVGIPAEIFARLIPAEDSDRPIRESRADVRSTRFSDATVTFEFEPIPNSGGKLYDLAVGVLSGPTPFVFLGLTGGEAIPEGAAVVSGAPASFADDLAIRTSWNGRLIDWLLPQVRQNWLLIGEVGLHILLWVLLAVIPLNGLSIRGPYFWRGCVWPAVRTSALLTVGIFTLAVVMLAVWLPRQLT